MARPTNIVIKESLDFLKKMYSEERNHRIRIRIKCLILLKEARLKGQLEIANHLSVDYATVKRWLKQYKEEGIKSLTILRNGGQRRSAISHEVHQSLSAKLNDSTQPLLGYWDAVLWVNNNHGLEIKYNTLRTYLIRHFKTKLKAPRKSHYKKNEQAIEAFKKTT